MNKTSASVVPASALADLHSRIDHALTHRDRTALAGVRAVVHWLATLDTTIPVRQLEARAAAAVRFVGGQAHV